MGITDKSWMELAYKNALLAQKQGEVPVGAVLVTPRNFFAAYNKPISSCDPTSHAEINAIRKATHFFKNYRLQDATLYVTLEPCIMCMGAIFQARIKRLVFGCRNFKTGAAGSVYNYGFSKLVIDEGVLQRPCLSLIKDFF